MYLHLRSGTGYRSEPSGSYRLRVCLGFPESSCGSAFGTKLQMSRLSSFGPVAFSGLLSIIGFPLLLQFLLLSQHSCGFAYTEPVRKDEMCLVD